MLLHSIVYACRCARVQAEFEAAASSEPEQRPRLDRETARH